MPQVARLGDICTGHSCYPPRPNIEACKTVFCNGRLVHCENDMWAVHSCGGDKHKEKVTIEGYREKVVVEGDPIARVGDPIGPGCGSRIATGSTNVFAGG